ncbi:putative transporter [bioreactor metagenome]|uniref:Putative transporter n=1 Tax=bioreactor metagenome TaxID=1076179 RepID=A0A645HT03_9ZZZZ
MIALSGACVMLIIGKQDTNEIISSVEWSTILFFIGLFIVVGGLSESGVIDNLAQFLINLTKGNTTYTMCLILWISAIISSFLDNIPFVATLIPLILTMESQGMNVMPLWWATSLGACLGGNGTLIGASANVVLANIGEKHGYDISFNKYFKLGFPVMLLTVFISTIYLLLKY